MPYSTEYISQGLKRARIKKGLSQRELSKMTNTPQSHISKIESANVDLRLSSLVTIARALDLELSLIPRQHLAAVNSITGDNSATQNSPPRPAYSLDEDE